MRIAHVIDNLGPGGNERQCAELLKGLTARAELEHLLVVLSPEVFYPGLEALARLRVVPVERRFRKDVRIVGRVCRALRGFRPDVVVAYESLSAVCAAVAARLLGARFANAMVQDAPRRLSRTLRLRRALTFPLAQLIVANSEAGARAYAVPRAKMRVIRNGFDPARLARLRPPADVRAELGLGDRQVVGMVASFSSFKDQPTFIRAAETILASRRDVVFLLVGGGDTLPDCHRMPSAANREAIRFTGRRTDVEAIVNLFDVGVLATYTEGISNAIMEYMALGKPVVATRGGGTAELVVEGETAFLTDAGDATALARRIAELLADEELRRRMGRAGADRIGREFSLDRMVGAHRRLYDEMLESRGGPGRRGA